MQLRKGTVGFNSPPPHVERINNITPVSWENISILLHIPMTFYPHYRGRPFDLTPIGRVLRSCGYPSVIGLVVTATPTAPKTHTNSWLCPSLRVKYRFLYRHQCLTISDVY